MSFVIANPEMLAAAATDLAGIRSAISAATAAAAAPTIQVAAAGADEVSLAISALFGQHAQAYQALSAQATIFHDQFVQALTPAATCMRPPRATPSSRWCSTRSTRPPRHCSAAR
ncbi:Pe-pgrs family protein [Mycobacterium tuberculosis variant bovis BCG str. ATCC 35743]|nr:Pe-pgrs family protein [Mycobacterium tuberculosis variant bovis BCG str. ATCC 35743]